MNWNVLEMSHLGNIVIGYSIMCNVYHVHYIFPEERNNLIILPYTKQKWGCADGKSDKQEQEPHLSYGIVQR